MRSKKILAAMFLIVLSMFFMQGTGCTEVVTTVPNQETEALKIETNNDTATPNSVLANASATPAADPATSTSTFAPNTAVPLTVTPRAQSATPKPLPTATLSAEQIDAILAELMVTNDDCELPCWWGIVPGETSADLAQQRLTSIGASFDDITHAGIGVEWGMGIHFDITNQIVQSIEIHSAFIASTDSREKYMLGWQSYELPALLSRYGPPSQVLVHWLFEADPAPLSYRLLVFYEDSGIEIDYTGNAEALGEGRYRACPNLTDIWNIHLLLYQPDLVENVVEQIVPASSISYIAEPEIVHEVISWQQATDTPLEAFYETFRIAGEVNACFEFSQP